MLIAEGRAHDASMLRDSGLLEELEAHSFSPTGEVMCLYGDPAYPHRIHLQRPFTEPPLTPAMKDFNTAMSRVHSSVLWVFGDIVNTPIQEKTGSGMEARPKGPREKQNGGCEVQLSNM